jgi:magnesium-transporting ATPase (P-type)
VKPTDWHALDPEESAARLGTSLSGLREEEASARLERFGPNKIQPPKPTPHWQIALRQFQSPLIYVLLLAGAIAALLGEPADSGFIAAVLVVNATIGFVNEFRADRAVRSLSRLVSSHARVHRDGRVVDVDTVDLVPGDLLLLEGGVRVGADMRLVETRSLHIDESLLSGESLAIEKHADAVLEPDTALAERVNMAFAGSLATSGRGLGLVTGTGAQTELGAIAAQLQDVPPETAPLQRRMERFARRLGAAAAVLCAVLVGLGLARSQPLEEVLLGAIALAVSAIPEGLPVALTVALAVAVSRMARRGVVVRHLPAVEALGSCGVIATDKTGTLTRNQLTVERVLAGSLHVDVTGVGYQPEGEVLHHRRPVLLPEEQRLFRLTRAACLANEGSLTCREEARTWEWSGDPTDVALLAFGIKAGLDPVTLIENHELIAALPFESERRYAATLHRRESGGLLCVKGAPEQVIAMCNGEYPCDGPAAPWDPKAALAPVEALMRRGYRVLAIAEAETTSPPRPGALSEPTGLSLLGFVCMTDPPRPGVSEAVASCHRAGIRVIMVTGDHAATALAVSERIGIAAQDSSVLDGETVSALDDHALEERMASATIVARATPAEKLRVVEACQRRGNFVAVTGDGVNDAPALRRADLGVAMGREGTDVAREAADLVITDDDFSSIVAGVEEGRFAYENLRKVAYLLVSTGAGEVLLVTSALALGLPIPLTAVQLLWLNLVTNGIQDVALAFEPGEPGALERPPRPPRQGIFDRLMLERTLLAGLVFGGLGLACFSTWLAQGRPVDEARNLLVQLFVAFEILHIGNSRSETRSIFRMSPFDNPLLLVGTLSAFAVHVAALHSPFFRSLLDISVPAGRDLAFIVMTASAIVVIMELHKEWRRRHPIGA